MRSRKASRSRYADTGVERLANTAQDGLEGREEEGREEEVSVLAWLPHIVRPCRCPHDEQNMFIVFAVRTPLKVRPMPRSSPNPTPRLVLSRKRRRQVCAL